MADFYSSNRSRHPSPTGRLIQQKHSAFEHKKVLQKHKPHTQQYGIHYTSEPGFSHVIEPIDGELDYVAARKNPVKFYKKLENRAVISHELKNISPRKLHLNSTVQSL